MVSSPFQLFWCGLTFLLASSCSYQLEYRGDFGRGFLPANEGAAPFVEMEVVEASSRLFVLVPSSLQDGGPGHIVVFSLLDGAYLGAFRDRAGHEISAFRLVGGLSGALGVVTIEAGPQPAYGLSQYSAEGDLIRKAVLDSPIFGVPPVNPAVSFTMTGDGVAVLFNDPLDRTAGGLLVYSDVFSAPRVSPVRMVDLDTFRSHLPVALGGQFRATALHHRDGTLFLALDLVSEPFDGVLVLDKDLQFRSYLTGEWEFDGPDAVTTDSAGTLYVSNRWQDNLSAFAGDRLLTTSAKDYLYGSEGILMNGPGSLAVGGDNLFVYDSGNGRILRFSTILPGTNPDRARLEAFERPIILRHGSESGLGAWVNPFFLGFFAMMALHGFFVGLTSRERPFLLLGLSNLAALFLFIERSYYRFFIDLSSADSYFPFTGISVAVLILFTRDYVSARKRPGIDRSFVALSIVAAVSALLAVLGRIFDGAGQAEGLIVALDILWLVLTVSTGVLLVIESIRRNREARISLGLNLGLLVTGSLSLGILNDRFFAGTGLDSLFRQGYPLMLGFLVNSLVLSQDLGSRLGTMKVSRESVREENEALREADRRKTDFVMNVSHELRTPLSVILGSVEQLESESSPTTLEDHREALKVIGRNARKLLKDITNLLESARLDRQGTEIRKVPVVLGPFLRTVVAEFSSLSDKRGLSLTLGPVGADLNVLADPDLLEAAVLNLVSNALKFTPSGGNVTVRASRDEGGRMIRVEVVDTGIGIDQADLKRLFERFFRAGNGWYRKQDGAGIGLSLVREICLRHGGRVEVVSETGKGSTFSLVLPYEPGPWETEGQPPAAPILRTLDLYRAEFETSPPLIPVVSQKATGTILLVEDNSDLRTHLTTVLSQRFRVRTASNGVEALASLEETLPDGIVSDIMMPELDGAELLAQIRADPRWKAIPFLFLSARADLEERIQSLRDGALDYIEKPFATGELVAKVEALLDWNRAVTSSLRTRIKDSITTMIDNLDGQVGFSPEVRGLKPVDYERFFQDRGLSDRETEVVRLLLTGRSDKEIAHQLHITVSTVGNHNTRIFRKLGVSSRIELMTLRILDP